MITSRIRTFETFPQLTAHVEELTMRALAQAAEAGKAAADERAQGITEFSVVVPRRTADGFASGIRARNPIWRVFDKGSLGKRTARLKRPNLRKDSWKVSRRGSTYEAHRGDTAGEGVAPRTISNPARTAGRRALLAAIRNR